MEHILAYTSSEEEETTQRENIGVDLQPTVQESATETGHPDDERENTSLQVHQGRIRSFPHVEGQFATHVYFELTINDEQHKHISQLLHVFDTGEETFHHMEEPFHVSLSRTVAITSVQIQSLLSGLKHALKKSMTTNRKRPRKGILEACSLPVRIGESASILVNDERTRTFLALSVSVQGSTPLEQVIHHVSKVFKRHGLPEYYKDPNIHTSIGWCLGNQKMHMQRLVESPLCQRSLKELSWSTSMTRILCRIGKKEHIIWSQVCR